MLKETSFQQTGLKNTSSSVVPPKQCQTKLELHKTSILHSRTLSKLLLFIPLKIKSFYKILNGISKKIIRHWFKEKLSL